MKSIVTTLLLSLVILVAACAGLQTATEGDIATDPQFVPEGTSSITTGIEIIDSSGNPTGRSWVVVSDQTPLPPEAPVIKPSEVAAGDMNAVATTWRAVDPLIPAGPWKALGPLVLYFGAKFGGKRYRQNWREAIGNAVSLDIKGAVRQVAAAEGIVHTTEDPDVLAAVAARKKAVAEAQEVA